MKAVKACPDSAVVLKWLDDVTNMAEEAFAFFKEPVRTWLCLECHAAI